MRDLKSELEVKEAKHFKRKAGDVFEGVSGGMFLPRCTRLTANDPAHGRACRLVRSIMARVHQN